MMRVLASLVKTLEKAMEEVKSYQWECCFEVYVFSKQCYSDRYLPLQVF